MAGLAIASVGLSAVNMAGSFIGGRAQSGAQRRAAAARARTEMLKAIELDVAADEELRVGLSSASIVQMKSESLRGAQVAILSNNRVRADSGTALALQVQSRILGEIDAATVMSAASGRSRKLKKDAASHRILAAAHTAIGDAKANATSKGAAFSAVGSLLQASSDIYKAGQQVDAGLVKRRSENA